MSQAGIGNITGANPDIPTQFTTDFAVDAMGNVDPVGTSIPSANNLNVIGGPLPDLDVINDNDNGVATYSNVNEGNNLQIFLTNRKVSEANVPAGNSQIVFAQDLGATPGTYNFRLYVAGFATAGPASCAFTIFGTVRTTGAAAVLVATQDQVQDKEAALQLVQFNIGVASNSVQATVINGSALACNFKGLLEYTFQGAP